MAFVAVRSTLTLFIALLLICDRLEGISQQTQPAARALSLLEQGEQAMARGEFPQALSDFEAALQLDPRNDQVNFRIGLLKGQSGDFAGAADAFRHVLRIRPNFPEAHYNLGLTMVADTKDAPAWTQAQVEFRAAVALRPEYPDALNMIGVCLLETNEPAMAIPQFTSALLLNPNSADRKSVV